MAVPDERFITHVDSTLLHDLHWPILGLLARHHVEHLELRHYLDDLPARGEWLFARAVPRPTERSRADDPSTEFDTMAPLHQVLVRRATSMFVGPAEALSRVQSLFRRTL